MEPISYYRRWPTEDGAWIIELHWAEVDGHFDCVGMEIRSFARDDEDAEGLECIPLTTSVLRAVPLATLIDSDRRQAVANLAPEVLERAETEFGTFSPRRRGRRPGGSPELEEIAQAYRDGSKLTDAPTRYVAERFGYSRSNAAKLVAKARAEGLLPQTTRGRATRGDQA